MAKRKYQKKVETIPCPVRGHHHNLELIEDKNNPDHLVAYCGSVPVYTAPKETSPEPQVKYSEGVIHED